MESIVPWLAVILFAAAFLQSVTGFGMALVCTAFVPLLLPVKDAIAFVSIACFIATIFIMLANRSGLSFRHAGPLALGMLVGIPFGYYGLTNIDGTLVVRILGVILMLIALAEFLQSRYKGTRKLSGKSGIFFGLIGGIITGAFNVGGPPSISASTGPSPGPGTVKKRSKTNMCSSSSALLSSFLSLLVILRLPPPLAPPSSLARSLALSLSLSLSR
jgi:uncharacterized membrane protein YfcA